MPLFTQGSYRRLFINQPFFEQSPIRSMRQSFPHHGIRELGDLVPAFGASMIVAFARTGLIFVAALGFLGLMVIPGSAQTRKLGDGLTFEGAGASFIGSGQTTTLNCAGGGAHILGNNNTLTLTGACKWLDMVGSNNTVVVAFGNGANIEFAGSNNAITWTSLDGIEPVVRHVGSGNTLTAGR